MNVIAEDIRPPVKIDAVLPTQSEVFGAVWSSAVEAAGGPAAQLVVERLNELAELYAAHHRALDLRCDMPASALLLPGCHRHGFAAEVAAMAVTCVFVRDDLVSGLVAA